MGTAEFDILRDEGRAFASRLALAGVAVQDRCVDGLMHGFESMTQVPSARRAMSRICAEFKRMVDRTG